MLRPMIETVIFLAKTAQAFRGNKDYGILSVPKHIGQINAGEGLFRASLQYRCLCGDEKLKMHLEKGHQNALYISSKVQNQMIRAVGNVITAKISEQISQSGVFGVIADETMDISGYEQLSISARIVNESNQIEEIFLGLNVALEHCDSSFFPNVKKLLLVLASIPITSVTAERSFSSLRLLKNYLRNRTKIERLSSLALAYINRDIDFSVDDVINEFAKKNRKIDFALGKEHSAEEMDEDENISL